MPVAEALFRRHDCSELVEATVAQVGGTLRVLTAQDCSFGPTRYREWAALVDTHEGRLVGEAIAGRGSQIDVGPILQAMDSTRRYVLVHTHPNSSSISIRDADILLAYLPLPTVVVVGLDGTWFLLSKARRPASRQDLYAAYEAERRRLQPLYLARQRAEGLSGDEIWRLGSHEIWATIAGGLGLVYDRVEPEEAR